MSEAANTESVNLLQLTDTHLFKDAAGKLLGITTQDSFHAILHEIDRLALPFDLILATGDIVQDQTQEAYAHFVSGIARWQQPCYWIGGNHDERSNMWQIMQNSQLRADKCIDVGANWIVVLLDSQVEGYPYGILSAEQLDFLQDRLVAYPHHHVLISLHHNVLPVGSAWLDQHKLKNSAQFWEVVDKYPQVKAVLGGHVHQEFDQMYHGVRIITSPATCVQFKPHSKDFALDERQPGWRRLTLNRNGELQTQVYRLPGHRYQPDTQFSGY